MIDFTSQINLSRKLSKMKTDIFKFVSELAQKDAADNRAGLLLIVGNFAHNDYKLEKFIQLGTNDLEGHPIVYGTKAFKDALEKFRFVDGAFVLDSSSGQLLGNRVLYTDLKQTVEEDRGARHHAAASASLDPHIDFVVTVSEEDGAARLYVGGKVEEQQDISTGEQIEQV